MRRFPPCLPSLLKILAFGALFLEPCVWTARGALPDLGQPPLEAEAADKAFSAYFRSETLKLQARCLPETTTLPDLLGARESEQRQLREMFGLDPLPPKTDLKPVITGRLEHADFTVEKLHFQSKPGLYVTGNLYLPKNLGAAAPGILYLCGHSRMKGEGVSYGNKTGYQHWGSWFARNGYVCLIIDSVQLGEIEGWHSAPPKTDVSWWNSRGYSPAAAEAWNSIRALDYLETRPEVDKTRLGVTGRSGGGAYSWALAALDERVKVACPTAGITDLQNHVVDGCISGHCPCMFMVNTYRWDYAQLAALVAPRPLLLCNTDSDGIFPLDGVSRIHGKLRRVYDLHRAGDKLGLLVTPGPHKDSEALQVPVMQWFNKWLKGEEAPLVGYAQKLFPPRELRVFDRIPGDETNSRCHEDFMLLAADSQALDGTRVLADLKLKSFGAWPEEPGSLGFKRMGVTGGGASSEIWEFQSCPEVALKLQLQRARGAGAPAVVTLLLEERGGERVALGEEAAPARVTAVFCPSGAGTGALVGDATRQNHFRRRFMQLGGTLAGMQVWEVRRAIEALRTLPELRDAGVELRASRALTEVACFAALFEPAVRKVSLACPPRPDKEASDFLNWSRILTPAQLLELTRQKCQVEVRSAAPGAAGGGNGGER